MDRFRATDRPVFLSMEFGGDHGAPLDTAKRDAPEPCLEIAFLPCWGVVGILPGVRGLALRLNLGEEMSIEGADGERPF